MNARVYMHTHTCGNLSTIPTKRGLYNISLNAIIVSAFKGLKIKELHSFMKCLSLKEGISDRGRQRTQTTRIYIRNSNIISWLKISSADGFQIGIGHDGELIKVFGLAIHIRADIDDAA